MTWTGDCVIFGGVKRAPHNPIEACLRTQAMGYSNSPRSVSRVARILDKLITLPDGDKIEIDSDDPKRLAYAIHEAFRIIRDNPTAYPKYATVATNFKARIIGSAVRIEPKLELIKDVTQMAKAIDTMVIPDVTSLIQIIGAIVKHKAAKLSFPNANLDNVELERFSKWCGAQNYSVNLLEPLTVSRCNESSAA